MSGPPVRPLDADERKDKPSNLQVIHTVGVHSGKGDMVYFLNWYKIYHKHVKDSNDKIIFFKHIGDVDGPIIDLKISDLEHPIFQIVDVNADGKLVIKDPSRCAIQNYTPNSNPTIDLDSVFSDKKNKIDASNVRVVNVSTFTPKFKIDDKEVSSTHCFPIQEFGHARPGTDGLGLGESELGLLTDPDGVTGKEELGDIMKNLSPDMKQQIFENKDITVEEAKTILQSRPNIFGYLQLGMSVHALHSIYTSPYVQDAIKKNQQPLFFLTGFKGPNGEIGMDAIKYLPQSLQDAHSAGKIKIILPGFLEAKDYGTVNKLFMNQNTNSVIVTSGDNSFSEAIKAGKLPFPTFLSGVRTDGNPKRKIFRDLSKLIENTSPLSDMFASLGADKTILYSLQVNKHLKLPHYEKLGEHLSQETVEYFTQQVAPGINENFNFETRSLPSILEKLFSQANLELNSSIKNPPPPILFKSTTEDLTVIKDIILLNKCHDSSEMSPFLTQMKCPFLLK